MEDEGSVKTLRVVYFPVGGPPEVREIESTLRALQELVGGYIQTACLWADKEFRQYIAIADEEGRIKGLKPSLHGAYEQLVGPIVITKSDGVDDFTSLSNKDIGKILERIAHDILDRNKDHPHPGRER